MIFCRDNYEDIKKYFQGSYMKFPLIGDEVVFVENVSTRGMTGQQTKTDEHDAWEFTFGPEWEMPEMEFLLPKKSFFEYDGHAYLLCRIPAKQYSRGITDDNTCIAVLGAEGFCSVGLTLPLLNAYTAKPVFKGFRLEGYGSSYPVSSRMAVDPQGRIFIDKIRIGHLAISERKISCNVEMFAPEIEQVLREFGQPIELNVKKARTKPAPKPVKINLQPPPVGWDMPEPVQHTPESFSTQWLTQYIANHPQSSLAIAQTAAAAMHVQEEMPEF